MKSKYGSLIFICVVGAVILLLKYVPLNTSTQYSATVQASVNGVVTVTTKISKQTYDITVDDSTQYISGQDVVLIDKEMIDGKHEYSIKK